MLSDLATRELKEQLSTRRGTVEEDDEIAAAIMMMMMISNRKFGRNFKKGTKAAREDVVVRYRINGAQLERKRSSGESRLFKT